MYVGVYNGICDERGSGNKNEMIGIFLGINDNNFPMIAPDHQYKLNEGTKNEWINLYIMCANFVTYQFEPANSVQARYAKLCLIFFNEEKLFDRWGGGAWCMLWFNKRWIHCIYVLS